MLLNSLHVPNSVHGVDDAAEHDAVTITQSVFVDADDLVDDDCRTAISRCGCAPATPGAPTCISHKCFNYLEMTECVKCGPTCCNKRIQSGVQAAIEVRWVEHKGRGLFAAKDLPADTFLCEYVGEVISRKELERRMAKIDSHEAAGGGVEHLAHWLQLLAGTAQPRRCTSSASRGSSLVAPCRSTRPIRGKGEALINTRQRRSCQAASNRRACSSEAERSNLLAIGIGLGRGRRENRGENSDSTAATTAANSAEKTAHKQALLKPKWACCLKAP